MSCMSTIDLSRYNEIGTSILTDFPVVDDDDDGDGGDDDGGDDGDDDYICAMLRLYRVTSK